MKAPNKCPVCGNYYTWKKLNTLCFNFEKSAVGVFLFGAMLVGQFNKPTTKNKTYFYCENCGFSDEYDT